MTGKRRQPGFLSRADEAGRFVENAALVAVLTAMILLAAAQIILRNFLESGFAWGDEALRLMVLWVAILGAVAASRENRHISIDVLARVLPPVPRAAAAIIVRAFTSAVSFVLAWYSWEFVSDSREYHDLLLDDLPAWWFQVILPAGFFLIGYRYAIWFLRGLVDLRDRLFDGARRP
ncbi:MAG: TRAP transporter small permease [Gammaproteobacteria bacterium]